MRQQGLGQGVAQPVLVVVGAPSSMASEFGVCIGIGQGTVGGRSVCGAHSFAEGSVAEEHGNVGGLVPVATSAVSGDEVGQGGVGGAGVSQDAMCERRALEDASGEMSQPGQLGSLVGDGPDCCDLGKFEDVDPRGVSDDGRLENLGYQCEF